MARRSPTPLTRAYQRNLKALTKATLSSGKRLAGPGPACRREAAQAAARARRLAAPASRSARPARGAFTSTGRPSCSWPGEKLPLMVMLHGCGQTGRDFAVSTRMNRLATRERFLVLYPEQDRIANAQGCWNWFERRSGKADAEAATSMAAVDQVCLLYGVDRERVAVAGLSAGASMAALLATRYPLRFKAVAMHSGVAPGAARSPATALGAMRGQHVPPMPATASARRWARRRCSPRCRRCWCSMAMPTPWSRPAMPAAAPRSGPWPPARGPARRAPCSAASATRCAVTDYTRRGRTVVTLVRDRRPRPRLERRRRQPCASAMRRGRTRSRMVWSFAARQFRLAERPA